MSNSNQKLQNVISLVMSDLDLIHEQVCFREEDFGGNAWTAASVNVTYNICLWKAAIVEEVGDLNLYREWEAKCEAIKAVMVELAKQEGGAA
ncbi:hypothetical protein CY658_21725 [Variovorax sp. RO1]|uniref:hypothetical protein n=1 Tax=Variovorax sp. RO1 TaxID=2066034 RepID=UPI000C716C5C|nr:hypothetical protein [Variovorax sp. RO1]PLC03438.1 hypothetical protein CY658_21725 [Variovorax sp. RO1]